jgi:TrmH family RNA methyltransferase
MDAKEIIRSKDNAKLKLAREVRDGRDSGLVFIEGFRLAAEALRSRLVIRLCLISEDIDAKNDLMDQIAAADIPTSYAAAKLFAGIADTKTPQGIIMLAEKPANGKFHDAFGKGLLVLLKEANDPSNIGAILRTAEAAGVGGVMLTEGSADAFSPKALRASMGAAFRVPVWQNVEFADAIKQAKESGMIVTVADIKADKNYTDIDRNKTRLLVFGSEAHGLDDAELKLADEIIKIQMKNGVESLNLAVSAGIIMFEAARSGLTQP